MDQTTPNIIPSGIEPVDKLLGGLESGQLYLVHGDASGKSLFGIKFLIEGLKQGESGAIVIRYSPEDAVRRFARLGYDCLEDIYSGRMVILEYSDDIVQQIARLRELTPVLRELEWLLGENKPQRIIFDPVASLVLGEVGDLESRVREFAAWAKSFGATVVLVANGEDERVVQHFIPLVKESFRFAIRETGERVTRFLTFEKSPSIAEQPIEVDPARGVFLLGRAQEPAAAAQSEPPPSGEPAATESRYFVLPDLTALSSISNAEVEGAILEIPESGAAQPAGQADTVAQPPELDLSDLVADLISAQDQPSLQQPSSEPPSADHARQPETIPEPDYDFAHLMNLPDAQPPDEPQQQAATPSTLPAPSRETSPLEKPASFNPTAGKSDAPQGGALPDLFDDLSAEILPLELEDFEKEPVATEIEASEQHSSEEDAAPEPDVDSVVTARAVEMLLRPPDSNAEMAAPASVSAPRIQPAESAAAPAAVNPKDFNVLIIDDDPASCDLMAHSLSEYTTEVVHDGVSGLAKLISFRPDVVILDIDLPIVDGFKVLSHIRASLNMPVIVVSGSHMRASDRVLSTELGADYYLTKPFSVKELRQKVRQLIARYRGISSWIVTSHTASEARALVYNQARDEEEAATLPEAPAAAYTPSSSHFLSYDEFMGRVEKSVKSSLDVGASFSIVGCRLPNMTAHGGLVAIHLYELVSTLVRDSDCISTNPRNDLVVMLADADAAGARAFISRLRERIIEEVNQEPSVWMRSFPDLEEAVEPSRQIPTNGSSLSRRASDHQDQANQGRESLPFDDATTTAAEGAAKSDPRESYIDFLEQL